jgi:hypothetical protein
LILASAVAVVAAWVSAMGLSLTAKITPSLASDSFHLGMD